MYARSTKYRDPITKLLEKEEEDMKEENIEKRKRVLRFLNEKLIAEQKALKALGSCPICHLVLTTTKKCPRDHQF